MAKSTPSNMRDPLFVITASLEIIKHRSDDQTVQAEVQRIEKALDKIRNIIN